MTVGVVEIDSSSPLKLSVALFSEVLDGTHRCGGFAGRSDGPLPLYTQCFVSDYCAVKRLVRSVRNAAQPSPVPVLVRVIRLDEARRKRAAAPGRAKQTDILPSPEVVKAALGLWHDIRKTGVVSKRECFYHIARHLLSLADHRVLNSPVLDALEEEMKSASAQDKNNVQWQLEEEADRIIAATLREYGEVRMAYLYENDRVKFHRLYKEGRKKTFGPFRIGNAGGSKATHSRYVKRANLKATMGGSTGYWKRLANMLSTCRQYPAKWWLRQTARKWVRGWGQEEDASGAHAAVAHALQAASRRGDQGHNHPRGEIVSGQRRARRVLVDDRKRQLEMFGDSSSFISRG